MLEIVPVTTARQRREFIRCAWPLHRDHPAWVPPLIFDLRRQLDPQRGEYFRHGNSGALFLARRAGVAVGRIAAFRNEAHLRAHADGVGFFGFFECEDDPATAAALLRAAEDWLRAAGLRIARGPANFNIQEEAGILLDGFEHTPMTAINWTPPYFRPLLESAGYTKAKDLLVYRLDHASLKLDQLDRVSAAALRRPGVVVRPLDLDQLEREGDFLATIFAEAWRDNWGMVPISAAEFREAYARYRLFIVPELALLAEIDGEPAGVMLAMPDMNVLLRQMRGRLFPTGLFHLLFGRRKIARYRTFMLGVRPKFRRAGLPLVFISRLRTQLLARRAEMLEFSWILEDNHEVRTLIERVGGQRAQTLRLYERSLFN